MGVTLALCSMICFGSNILISRVAMTRMSIELGFFIVLFINIAFSSAVFGVEMLFRETPFVWHWREAGFFALGGFVGTYLGRRLMFDTIRLLGPARASVVHSVAPAFTLVVAWVLVGEKLGAYELALTALVIFGLWFTQPVSKEVASEHRPAGGLLSKGFLIGLATVIGFALSNVCRGYSMRTWNEAVFGTIIASVVAFACQLATSRNWGESFRGILKSDPRGGALYVGCGVATASGAMFLVSAMQYMEIALATLVTHTTPLMIFPVSLFLFKNREGLSARTGMGAALVLAGIALLAVR